MGDRYYLKLNCAYCSLESDVYYAPTCGFYDFKCQALETTLLEFENSKPVEPKNSGCGRINFITADFAVKKIEDVTEDDVVAAFEMATNVHHSLDSIKRMAKGYLKGLKKHGRPDPGTAARK